MEHCKKSKFRRRINRMKNKIQYLKKRVSIPVVCFMLVFSLFSVTLYATKQQIYATGIEEILYYTYWDLMSGLFAETGYEFSSPDSYYAQPNRVSGKQVWDNFCKWVEEKAKVLALPVEIVNDTIFNELENLPNVVDAAGVSMSEALAELLGTVLPTAVDCMPDPGSMKNEFDTSSKDKIVQMLVLLTGCAQYDNLYKLNPLASSVMNGQILNMIYCPSSQRYIIWLGSEVLSYSGGESNYFLLNDEIFYTSQYWVNQFNKNITSYSGSLSANPDFVWIIHNGALTGVDGTALSDFARVKVKEKTDDQDGVYIPGVGWKTDWELWKDTVRVTTDEEEAAWNARYNFDNNDDDEKKKKKEDNKKDRLPVAIPIPIPGKDKDKDSEKESESESESEEDTEPVPGPIPDPDPDPDPDPTEDDSEDDTETQKHYQEVIDSGGKAGNWKKLFPFCIPWDIMTMIKSMNAEKKAPHFKYEHTFKGINYTFSIDVDMSDYWKYIKIFRWGMTIFFLIGLFFLTVKFTTFVHRGS